MMLPVPGDRVSCGNRADLPRKQRRHQREYLGLDVRHVEDGSVAEVHVVVCVVCGRDRAYKNDPR